MQNRRSGPGFDHGLTGDFPASGVRVFEKKKIKFFKKILKNDIFQDR
jgi:hypothetical protein